jgi:hypothetical protein
MMEHGTSWGNTTAEGPDNVCVHILKFLKIKFWLCFVLFSHRPSHRHAIKKAFLVMRLFCLHADIVRRSTGTRNENDTYLIEDTDRWQCCQSVPDVCLQPYNSVHMFEARNSLRVEVMSLNQSA